MTRQAYKSCESLAPERAWEGEAFARAPETDKPEQMFGKKAQEKNPIAKG